MKLTLNHRIVLDPLFLTIFLLFSTQATYSLNVYDADGVYWSLLFEDLFRYDGNIFNWKLAPGMTLDLGSLVYFFAAFLTANNLALSSIIVTFLALVVLFSSMSLFMRESFHKEKQGIETLSYQPQSFILLFITIACMYSSLKIIGFFYYYAPFDIALSFITTSFLFKFFNFRHKKHFMLFLICVIYGTFSSEKYLIFFTIPLVATLTLFHLLGTILDHFNDFRFSKFYIFLILSIIIIERLLIKWVWPNYVTAGAYLGNQGISIAKMQRFQKLFLNLILGQNGYFHTFSTILFITCFMFLLFYLMRWIFRICEGLKNVESSSKIECQDLFIIILTFFIASVSVFSFLWFTTPSPYYYRYFSFLSMWLLFFGTFKLTRTRLFHVKNHQVISRCGLIATLIMVSIFLLERDQMKDIPSHFMSLINYDATIADMENAQCIDQNRERYDLKTGIANFWIARPITAMSKKGIRVNQVTWGKDPLPYFWEVNRDWFLKNSSGFGDPVYNFIIIPKNAEAMKISTRHGLEHVTLLKGRFPEDSNHIQSEIRKRFGRETASFTCSNYSSIEKVLVYSGDTDFNVRLKNMWLNNPHSVLYEEDHKNR